MNGERLVLLLELATGELLMLDGEQLVKSLIPESHAKAIIGGEEALSEAWALTGAGHEWGPNGQN